MLAQFIAWLGAFLGNIVVWVLRAVVRLLRLLGELFPDGDSGRPGPVGPVPGSQPPEPPRLQLPTIVLPDAEFDLGLAMVALAVLVAFVYLQLLARARTSVSESTLEEGSSAWSWALSRRQALDAWKSLLDSLRSRTARAVRRIVSLRSPRGEALRDIRQIYRALLRWAAEHGHHRPPDATPYEFAAQLAPAVAHAEEHVALITMYYVEARYGRRVLDEAELRRARQCLNHLLSGVSEPQDSV
jgi:hypothetical protein